jgi:hypothetical protein
MSTSKIMAAVAVIAFSAVPAVAGDHNLAAELESGGRYPAQTTARTQFNAWSLKSRAIRHGYSAWPEEFQLQGR